MQLLDGRLVYGASDLNGFLECRRLIELDTLAALGKRGSAPREQDPQVELVQRKGEEHEHRHLEELRRLHGDRLVAFERPEHGVAGYEAAARATVDAMRSGAPIVYQATFLDGRFLGHADFLRRVEVPSNFGDWSYEVIDTKLALHEKPYFIVQICNYSEHLERVQGVMPEYGYVVLGSGEERRFRLHDFLAYYRRLKARFLEEEARRAGADEPSLYPQRVSHCAICAWQDECARTRAEDDHLSLVARMRRDQIAKLNDAGISTVATLALATGEARPSRMAAETFETLRRQALMQVRGRTEGPVYQLLPPQPHLGFELLPPPNEGDVFFDMEGDPLYAPGAGGLEYLFGSWMQNESPQFKAFWGTSRRDEKTAFEGFVNFIIRRRRRFPEMHVYHYADYEKSALRRLAMRHATREEEVDNLLRGEVLVDLYAVVRQTLVISEDSYSIKRLEKFYGFRRRTDVKKGDDSIVMFEKWMETRDPAILEDIERYNEDDCRSTYLLREWLLERLAEARATFGDEIAFRVPRIFGPNGRPLEDRCHPEFLAGCKQCENRAIAEREAAAQSDVERELLAGTVAPETETEYRLMSEPDRARYLLAHLVAYHRREDKPVWWAYYNRCQNADELVERDGEALGGLTRADVPPYKRRPADKNLVYTYAFPEQRHKMSVGDKPHDPRTQKEAGEIVALDERANLVAIKRSRASEESAPLTALIPSGPLRTREQRAALQRIGRAFLAGSLEREHPATFDVLTARDPRVRSEDGSALRVLQPDRVDATSVSRVVRGLDNSYLFMQGPPGSGKSTIAAKVIVDLLRAGKRVGVTSTGHKAIHHILHKVEAGALEAGLTFRGLYKASDANGGSTFVSRLDRPYVESVTDAAEFGDPECRLAGGTAWLFTRDELDGAFDYLFVDEAGQVSLADALALSACANNVVFVGDPLQLAQVSQGGHPLHAGDSVLQHLLGEEHTVPAHRGIFLDVSYRMHPGICAFISDAIYDGRLRADAQTSLHRVTSDGLSGYGLRFLPVAHDDNDRSSEEEAARIVAEVQHLLRGRVVNDARGERPLLADDLIIVSPYNAQRLLIRRRLEEAGIDVRVGTVDKFQGQEAAVVFYSMATSSGDDVPRDVEFLLEENRFNVAISRARAMSVLLCSPRLLDIPCANVEQMRLANLLCTFAEIASHEYAPSLRA